MGVVVTLILILGTLTACFSGAMSPEVVKNTRLAVPLPVVLEAEPTITYAVDTVLAENTCYAKDGAHLLTYSFHTPQMTAFRSDGTPVTEEDAATGAEQEALAKTVRFNEEFQCWTSTACITDMVTAAEKDLEWFRQEELEWHDGYTSELLCDIYQTENIVSISGLYYTYTGGAHGNSVLLSWNFDLDSGEYFAVESLAADGQELSDLITEEIIRQADERAKENEMKPEEFFWENYQEIAADWSSYAVYFDENGMTVGYSPYEMACYAAGSQTFTLSYEQLLPVLSDHGVEVLGLQRKAE